MNIEQRLIRLERSVRRWQLLSISLVTLFVAAILLGGRRGQSTTLDGFVWCRGPTPSNAPFDCPKRITDSSKPQRTASDA